MGWKRDCVVGLLLSSVIGIAVILLEYIRTIQIDFDVKLKYQQNLHNQELLSLRNLFNDKLKEYENRLIDVTNNFSTGVAFYAHLSHSITRLNKDQTIIFDRVITDTSSSYSGQTGIFTAPVSGIFVFNWNLMSIDEAGMDTALRSTGGVLGYGFIGHARPYNNGGNMVVARITKGTQVWVVKAATYGNYLHERFTTFSGFLLYNSE